MSGRHVELHRFIDKMRLYPDEKGYDDRAPYLATIDIVYETSTEVYICGANGAEITPADFTMAMELLQKMGIKRVEYEHGGKRRTRNF